MRPREGTEAFAKLGFGAPVQGALLSRLARQRFRLLSAEVEEGSQEDGPQGESKSSLELL